LLCATTATPVESELNKTLSAWPHENEAAIGNLTIYFSAKCKSLITKNTSTDRSEIVVELKCLW